MSDPTRAMEPEKFIIDLNKAVWYMLRRGATFFFPGHLAFMAGYLKAWQAQDQDSATQAMGNTYLIRQRYNPVTTLLRARWLPLALRQFTFTLPAIPLIFLGMSVLAGRGFYRMIRSSIRSIPPLLTAVVVVFVTSDAWRILGTGFSARPIALWVAFILAAWLFLIRYRYWVDIKTVDWQELLRKAESKGYLNSFIQLGAVPEEMEKPGDRAGRQFVYGTYMVLTLLSLLEVALVVAAALTVVGMILVSKSETNTLANGVHVYFTLPGHVVLTTQLVSLSITLGCFAAFFLVAGQRPEDRGEFMDSCLKDLRRSLLAYSVYRRACTSSAAWTGIPGSMMRLPAWVGWVVSLPLVIEECCEAFVSSTAERVEVRVVADPFRRTLHLAFGVADRELQAANHLHDQGTQFGFRVCLGRECRVGAGQVICGWPGWSAVLPAPATGAQPFGDRLLRWRLGWQVVRYLREIRAVPRDGRCYPGDRAGVR